MRKKKRNTVMIIAGLAFTGLLSLLFIKRNTIKGSVSQAVDWLKTATWDYITDQRINKLHPAIRPKAKEFITRADEELGIKLRVTSGLRTFGEQQQLYDQPYDNIDNDNDGIVDEADEKVTNARPGESYHNYGLAIDVVEIKNGKALWTNPNWHKIAQLGKSIGFEWGGDWRTFKDMPHFQVTFGKSKEDLLQLYNSGKRNGPYVDLSE